VIKEIPLDNSVYNSKSRGELERCLNNINIILNVERNTMKRTNFIAKRRGCEPVRPTFNQT